MKRPQRYVDKQERHMASAPHSPWNQAPVAVVLAQVVHARDRVSSDSRKFLAGKQALVRVQRAAHRKFMADTTGDASERV